MQSGYLLLETRPEHPQLVQVRRADELPARPSPQLKFAARFQDIDAALMHFHEGLRRRLVDLDAHLYRTELTDAVAVAEAIELPHRRVHIDAALANDPRLTAAIERLHQKHRRWQRIFNGVGIAALVLLLLTAVLGI